MKKRLSLLLFLIACLLLTSCHLSARPVTSPFFPSHTSESLHAEYEEILLTSLRYGDYALADMEIPYYHTYGTENTPLSSGGVAYRNGIYINSLGEDGVGFIEYNIREVSEIFDTFVCKIGRLDQTNTGRDRICVSFLVDGKLMSRTPYLSVTDDAHMVDVVIPYGAKTLRIECRTELGVGNGATVIGDGRFLHAQHIEDIVWPSKEK